MPYIVCPNCLSPKKNGCTLCNTKLKNFVPTHKVGSYHIDNIVDGETKNKCFFNLEAETLLKEIFIDGEQYFQNAYGRNFILDGNQQKLLIKNMKRYSIFPIEYPDLWEMYKNIEGQVWKAQEIDFSKDNFDSLNEKEQHYMKQLIFFFANSDAVVADNIALHFLQEVKILEAEFFYGFQIANEFVHSECYSLIVETYIKDLQERHTGFDAINQIPAVSKKMKWAVDYLSKDCSFEERLVAFACVEGLAFSSTFAGIFSARNAKKPLDGLFLANTFISRDEHSHYAFAVHLYNHHINNKLAQETIKNIILGCYETEKQFIQDTLEDVVFGISQEKMLQYIQYVTDTILLDFNCNPEFNVQQPFKFMEQIALPRKNNFFEKRGSDYTSTNFGGINLDLDSDF